ncbi:DUF6192 family protein [Streptomyces sp. NPDC018019]|uniref:DUF6192 family protein n=1 Tax=Streptomyces sp. NPDC018019 TaxID=3365030 RepID=UPI0037893140
MSLRRSFGRTEPNERTGRRSWDGDAAKRVVGWKTSAPVTVEEKVEAVADLVREEAVACRVAVDLLRRRMQFEQAYQVCIVTGFGATRPVVTQFSSMGKTAGARSGPTAKNGRWTGLH